MTPDPVTPGPVEPSPPGRPPERPRTIASPDVRPELGPWVRTVGAFLPDVARMFVGVVRDPRVPMKAKARAAGLLALGLSPLDAIPLLGSMEMAAAVALALRQLVKHAGEDVLREHWQGSDEGFRAVMLLVDAGIRPTRLLRRALRPGPH